MMASDTDSQSRQTADRIESLRRAIDAIDDRLLSLINDRLKLAAQIGSLKQVAGNPVKDREREKHIINRLKASNNGPIDNDLLSRVFVDIIRASCHLQNTIRRDTTGTPCETKKDQHG
ncbi:MAG: chorismate mutase [Desulfobacterales bacterium]|nr:chorismate mutase [Desulfobacterales bacterium]